MPKVELPPLLGPGLHEMPIQRLRKLCVDDFGTSITRKRIMKGLEIFISVFSINGIVAEIWVNGSFLTKKIDPEDADLVANINGDLLDNYFSIAHLVNEIVNDHDDIHQQLLCDAYIRVEWPPGNPNYLFGLGRRQYWLNTFGYALHSKEPKGIAVVRV